MKVSRVFTLALVATLAGCAAEEVAPPGEDVEATVADDADDVWASSLNSYFSKVQGEKQGQFKATTTP